jgi:hypothetical protein
MMKTIGSFLLTLIVVTGASLHASDAMKAIVTSYLEIQGRLVADNINGVKPAARAIGEQAARMGQAGVAIAKAAKGMEEAADIKAAREAFGGLSDAVIAVGDAEGWKDIPNVRVAFCPMVRKSWIQKEDAIKNPYYGTAMSTCGEFKKK